MTHPDSAVLLAHLDDELDAEQAHETRTHVATCIACRAALDEMRSTDSQLQAVLHEIDAGEPTSWNAAPAARTTISGARFLRRAAMFLLFSSAAAAAIVGTRELVMRDDTPAVTAEATTTAPAVAAISVTPSAGRVHIRIDGAGAASRVHVSLASAVDATVAIEGVAAPRVTAAAGRVDAQLDGANAVIRIELPESLREADVIAHGNVLVRLRDGVLTPSAATEGIPIARPEDP